MNKILISGATGTTGGAVVEELKAKGVPFVAAVHSKKKVEQFADQGIEAVVVDLGDPDSIEQALNGVTKAYSMSPLSLDIVQHGLNFVEAAARAGLKHVVRLSGLGADSPQAIAVGRWHRKVELALQDSGIPYTIVRPISFMQNYANFYSNTIRQQNAFYLPQGDGKVSLIDARDVAAVIAESLTGDGHEGKAYDLTGPEALSNYNIAKILTEVTGRQVNYIDVPVETAREGMINDGTPAELADAMIELLTIYKAGYGEAVSPTVEQILGRAPIRFEQFAEDYRDRF
jgi:uncharacterized protein YbjT (DUF2867 family)